MNHEISLVMWHLSKCGRKKKVFFPEMDPSRWNPHQLPSSSLLFLHHICIDPHQIPLNLSSPSLYLPIKLLITLFGFVLPLPFLVSQIFSIILTSPPPFALFLLCLPACSSVPFWVKAHFMLAPLPLPFSSCSSPVVSLLVLSSLTSVASGS
ncbi:hypothetical protein AMECASPLE_012747 [Ameca splendens]|uniref:Uncharacterized protein n=1 Tax=Ameca splendens TaxID=208324 RepID=A0ABV0ZX98_9TELE